MGQCKRVKVKWLEAAPEKPVGVTWGIPWNEGELGRKDVLHLTTSEGENIPIQSWSTAYWPDGSVKWSAHSAVFDKNLSNNYYISKDGAHIKGPGLTLEEKSDYIEVDTGKIVCRINKAGCNLIDHILKGGKKICSGGRLVCIGEKQEGKIGARVTREEMYESKVTTVKIEQSGPIRAVLKIEGQHKSKKGTREWLPFTVRLYFYVNTVSVEIIHTFIYDGNPAEDFIKGIGLVFSTPMSGELYNRHIRLSGDTGMFSEACQFVSRRYKGYSEVYPQQVAGKMLKYDINDDGSKVDMVQDMAVWDSFKLVQDSSASYVIQKRTKEECSWIDADHGRRSKGLAFAGSENGGLAVGVKNFWEKQPSSLEINYLSREEAQIKVWLWSPDGKTMDLRHYDTETHVVSSYEGAVKLRSTPYGIANTNEINLWCMDEIPEHEELLSFCRENSNPSLLVCEPEYYYSTKAFGIWSLPDRSTKTRAFIESQLDAAIEFYKNEVEQRKWYGFWNYGDFMHTYDPVRHVWKYDVGGYAWQNTELASNMWLWLSFLRTGRADIFRMAEAMTRHTSEVDLYHLGKFKGLGSRHNVLHWGCSCKEARIGMTGLHRYYYYLTADERLGDIFDEVRDSDFATVDVDPLWEYYPKDQFPTHARSGPDWATFSSNWFTEWERHENTVYRDKIIQGINSLKDMPFRLLSGSAFGYDPKTSKLFYMGEDTFGYHLAICMGEPQVWFEMAQVLKDKDWEDMLVEFGEFYYLSREEKVAKTSEKISRRWRWPMFATGIAAYAANKRGNRQLAQKVWNILLKDETVRCVEFPMDSIDVNIPGYIRKLKEIPWVTTNAVSQWCINVIVCLELIGEEIQEEI